MIPVAPELADKVLAANIRNVIKKVSDGGTLAADERKILEEFTQSDLGQARAAALLRRWAGGRRLGKEELAEISHLLPRKILDTPPVAPRANPNGYPKTLEAYAAVYDVSARNVKRWVHLGRQVAPPDLPPLESPADMPAWWGRRMKHRVPEKILQLAAQARPATSVPNPAPSAPRLPDPQAAPAPGIGPSSQVSLGVGMGAALQRAREMEEAASRKLREAIELNSADVDRLQRQCIIAVDLLRKIEKDSVEVLEAAGESVSRSELEKVLFEVHSNIEQGIRSHAERSLTKMGITLTHAQREQWNAEIDHLFDGLRESGFSQVPAAL